MKIKIKNVVVKVNVVRKAIKNVKNVVKIVQIVNVFLKNASYAALLAVKELVTAFYACSFVAGSVVELKNINTAQMNAINAV